MTDNDIIKAMECCRGTLHNSCYDCPLKDIAFCEDKLMEYALDLINRQKAEVEVLKKIQQKILSKQGDYTTNNATVCEDCEKLWINALLKAKSEAYKELADGLVTMFLNINESLNCEDIVENIKRFSSRLTEGRENG